MTTPGITATKDISADTYLDWKPNPKGLDKAMAKRGALDTLHTEYKGKKLMLACYSHDRYEGYVDGDMIGAIDKSVGQVEFGLMSFVDEVVWSDKREAEKNAIK